MILANGRYIKVLWENSMESVENVFFFSLFLFVVRWKVYIMARVGAASLGTGRKLQWQKIVGMTENSLKEFGS